MVTLYEISSRTRAKIISRMKLKCFNCDWDKTSCDLHHIIPQSKGGKDSIDNITHLCPNCHRLAHEGKLSKMISLEEKIGDSWKEFYHPRRAGINPNKNKEIKNRKTREEIRLNYKIKTDLRIEKILNSGIDFSKFGWVEKVAQLIELKPQKVSNWMRQHMLDHYETKCFRRKIINIQQELF